jgi:hypothetical protein
VESAVAGVAEGVVVPDVAVEVDMVRDKVNRVLPLL